MDNDKLIKKKIVSFLKNIKFQIDYADKKVLSENEGNHLIYQCITSSKPCMVVRLGAVEARCLYPWMKGRFPDTRTLENGMFCAGIFPANTIENKRFSKTYSDAIRQSDIMALWGVYKERAIVNKFCPEATFIRARSIEPYYYQNPWSRGLKDKRILVIHPFVDSIRKQYIVRNKIFQNQEILPQFKTIDFVKAVQSNAGAVSGFKDWSSAYEHMCIEISKKDFDIAIIGAGAYSLPLSAYIKKIGKIAIQMSGATQILFGIKGMRWDNHSVISKFYNEFWIRPSIDETPPKIDKVEGGSYW